MNGRLVLMLSVLLVGVTTVVPTSAQDDAHPTAACSAPYHVSGAGWDFCWQQDDPRAQGIELNQVYFHDASVLWKIGASFSLTQYDAGGPGPYKDVLGSPGAGGHPGYGAGSMTIRAEDCPRFGGGTGVIVNGGKLCIEHRGGPEPAVAIWARYNIFNYRFMQGYTMDSRGNMEPFQRMGGHLIDGNRGETGTNHFHHLAWRADFDIGVAGSDVAEVYNRPPSTPGLGAGPMNILDALTCPPEDVLTPGWAPLATETTDLYNFCTAKKWRVKGIGDVNGQGRERSFEFKGVGDTGANLFSTMDVMMVEYKGDSVQLGYEIPTNPNTGDQPIHAYYTPAEALTDPVAWMFQHVYHDTRDEDRGTMTYHHAHLDIHPRNFHDHNVGEQTYS